MEETMKRLEGTPMYYFMSGNPQGECLIFLHAGFADHTMYDKQAVYFGTDYQVIVPDLLGHGLSVEAEKGDKIEMTAQWLCRMMESEGIEKAHFIGVCLGAVLVQDFANKYPEKVSSLACISGYNINHFEPKMQSENGLAHMLMMLKAVFSMKWFAKSNRKISAYTKEGQEAFYQMNLKFPIKSFLYLAGIGDMVNKYPVSKRKYPLLIACGEQDIPMEFQAMEMWQQEEPACRKVIFEGAGHLVNLDKPDEFNIELEKLFKDSLRIPL